MGRGEKVSREWHLALVERAPCFFFLPSGITTGCSTVVKRMLTIYKQRPGAYDAIEGVLMPL